MRTGSGRIGAGAAEGETGGGNLMRGGPVHSLPAPRGHVRFPARLLQRQGRAKALGHNLTGNEERNPRQRARGATLTPLLQRQERARAHPEHSPVPRNGQTTSIAQERCNRPNSIALGAAEFLDLNRHMKIKPKQLYLHIGRCSPTSTDA